MKLKRILLPLALITTFLTGCTNSANTIEVDLGGLDQYVVVGSGYKVMKEEPLNATFDVYFGAETLFSTMWNDGHIGNNPGVGSFAIGMYIYDDNNNEIANKMVNIEDFLNYEKYPIRHEENKNPSFFGRSFLEYHTDITYDFSTIDVKKGYITIYITYYDGVNSDRETCYYYMEGIVTNNSQTKALAFQKGNDSVRFEYKMEEFYK